MSANTAATRVADRLSDRRSYVLEVPGVPNAAALSVVSSRIVERMGEPWRITVELTHPDDLLRADYQNKDATLTITPENGNPRQFHGWITTFSKLRTTKDFTAYRFVITAHVARLRLTCASRIFQRQTAPQIIEAMLRRHGLKGHQFAFTLRRSYPQHAFRLQHQLSDWDYIHLLMRQEGIYSYTTQGKHGDVLVFADDIDHYIYQPTLTLPYREPAGLNPQSEAMLSLQMHARTVPQSYRVADYNPEQAWERVKAEANVAGGDTTTYGQPYVFGTGHLDQAQAKWEARLRHEAAMAWQIVYEGESTSPALCCARIVHTDQDLPDAPNGMMVVEVIHTASRESGYRNTFKAIPAGRRFRLKLNEASWPKITGTLSARVTSPSRYTYAYLTQAGCYVVRFDLDFDPWNPGGESVPLRLAKPFAGKRQTGMHFPALDGDEAVIAFRDGDPNKPYIAAFHHHSQSTDLITNKDRWMSRNVIRTQADNKLEMEDWEGQEHVKLSTEHSGKSQLNLGHIVDGQRQQRGEGAELRTSGWMALRGGKGVFLSADNQPGANGPQLAMQPAIGLLQQALQLSESLAQAAATAEAAAADCRRQKALLDDTLDQLKKEGILVSAPAGIGLVSGSDLQLTAKENLMATAGRHADISVLKRFTIAAGECVSVFVQKLGIAFRAAKGDIDLQAQSGQVRLLADQDVTLKSVNGRAVVDAKNELLLKCGGSYVWMTKTGIEVGTRGAFVVKAADHGRKGANSAPQLFNDLPQTAFNDPYVLRNAMTGEILKHQPYEVVRDDGTRIQGITDESGRTNVQQNQDIERVSIHILPKQDGAA